MRKLMLLSISVCGLLLPQLALAANVYVPWLCETEDSDDSLHCTPDYEEAYQNLAGEWVIPIEEVDTVYFQVTDFTVVGAGTVVVSGVTEYDVYTRVNWTKSGYTATSPGETPEIDLAIEIEGQTNAKVYHGRVNVVVVPQGG